MNLVSINLQNVLGVFEPLRAVAVVELSHIS